ncbi:BZ3500_MvSof-1268-A1-R1_Chr3-1g06176 [Microbotryum saponariae]|uniref:BZ3500_MvSof-1268-A1-R1_Chr3-1g06176 protein n=1 Tax=Microbotryum saponariae TaxID=289078 RepID=A0A2X0LAY6_9BASI|nr:BZ3500_MvSof-1268-A1-R1_Chr3-1g06176 [Microbotryum saponariae]SDA04054.1 BZ3501_MvSof-1269-A2-R1_Chr3-2g05861 [Microbotryum saponariae]
MSTEQLPTPKTFHIGGIAAHVYGLSSPLLRNTSSGVPDTAEGVTVLFFLHGRFGHSLEPRYVKPIQSFLEAAERAGKKLVVIAFDQRNHGQRTVDKDRNKGWKDDGTKVGESNNESHAGDMIAIQLGTARDVSFLIDFAEISVWPRGEQRVAQWWCAGVSLGGHSTWLALAHEPRITLGIPIVGSPDMLTLLTARARSLDLAIEAPHFPSRLLELWQRLDPIHAPPKAYEGKRILILSGAEDELVNFVKGGTDDFVSSKLNKAVGKNGCVQVWVQEKTGHTYSQEMIERTCRFLVETGWDLSAAAQGQSLT